VAVYKRYCKDGRVRIFGFLKGDKK